MSHAQSRLAVITEPDAFLELKDEWDRLWVEADGHHNQAFRFCWLAWNHVANPRGQRLRCITVRENGRLVLVWPLISYRRGIWRVLNTLTPGTVEQSSMLVADGPAAAEAIAQAWHAASRLCGADVFFLPFVRARTALHDLASAHKGLIEAKQSISSAALLRNELDWTTLCKSLNRKPGIRERRLGRQGELDIRMLDLPDGEYQQPVDWILSYKRDWAARVDKRGPWLYSTAYRDFLVGLLESAGDEPLARIFVVELDKKVIASAMLGVGKGCHYYMIGSFVPEMKQFSPGTILNEFVIRWCLERRMDIDFGIGTEEFKAYWSRGNVKPTSSFQIANTLWGKVYFQSKDAARAVSGIRSTKGSETAEAQRAMPREAVQESETPPAESRA